MRLGPGRFTRVFTAPPAPPPDDVPDTDGHGRKHGHDHGRGLDLRKGHRRIHPATHSDRVEGWLHDASHSLNEVLAHLDAYHAAQVWGGGPVSQRVLLQTKWPLGSGMQSA